MPQLIDRFETDLREVRIDKNNTYIISYPEILKYISTIDKFNRNNFIICAHIIFAWMPAVIKLYNEQNEGVDSIDKAVEDLNYIKQSKTDLHGPINSIQCVIKNSLVGTSKLLHFVFPDTYPIWDSNVCKYWGQNPTQNIIQNIHKYMAYRAELINTINNIRFNAIHKNIIEQNGYFVSKLRAAEQIMFEMGRLTD